MHKFTLVTILSNLNKKYHTSSTATGSIIKDINVVIKVFFSFLGVSM